MDLQLTNRYYIVCGASSGFGFAIAKSLLEDGAGVLAVARDAARLKSAFQELKGNITLLPADVTQPETLGNIKEALGDTIPDGIVVNAGGPPAMKFMESRLTDWDNAYRTLVRWKIDLVQAFLPYMERRGFGRFVFVESAAVKQPLDNLVLSTSMRLAITGIVKTLSQELPDKGVTFNVMAPGYHETAAVQRLIDKKAQTLDISPEEAKKLMLAAIPMKKAGDPHHFATLALWLLSPLSDYVTGQVYALDGGVLKGTL